MAFTNYEYTKLYVTNEVETIVAYPTKIVIQMIQVYFPTAADTVTLTDAVSDSDFDNADDVICTLVCGEDTETQWLNWSALPRAFYGLKCSAITDSAVLCYIYHC